MILSLFHHELNQPIVASPSPSGGNRGDQIALGIGLGLGVPGAVMAIWQMCLWIQKIDNNEYQV
jgi:hypothetical protein